MFIGRWSETFPTTQCLEIPKKAIMSRSLSFPQGPGALGLWQGTEAVRAPSLVFHNASSGVTDAEAVSAAAQAAAATCTVVFD